MTSKARSRIGSRFKNNLEASPLPCEMQYHPKTTLIHKLLEKHFHNTPYVSVSSENNALRISAPSLYQLLITSMKVKAILKAEGIEKDVSLG